jgi:hypothetical protein
MSSVGCSRLSAATICPVGWLTGMRCSGVRTVENVWRKAADTCVGLAAATTAARPQPSRRGDLAGPGDQLPVPVPPRPDRLLRLLAAQLIGRDRGVGLLVRVNPDYHHQCLQSQTDAEAPGSRHGGHYLS